MSGTKFRMNADSAVTSSRLSTSGVPSPQVVVFCFYAISANLHVAPAPRVILAVVQEQPAAGIVGTLGTRSTCSESSRSAAASAINQRTDKAMLDILPSPFETGRPGGYKFTLLRPAAEPAA